MKKILLFILFQLCTGLFVHAQNEELVKKLANAGEIVNLVKQDTIPIEIWNDYILLKVKINNTENVFLWDNGFSFSAIDKSLISTYKLKEVPDIENITGTDAINAKVNLEIKVADVLSFGEFTLKQSPVLLTDMNAFIGDSNKVKGILGATAIKKVNWKFNFDENYVVVSEKPFDDLGKVIPFQLNPYNLLTIELDINGYKAPAEVDFGTNTNDLEVSIEAKELFDNNLLTPFFGIGGSSVSGFASESTSYSVKGFDYSFYNGLKLDFPFNVSLTPNERGARFGNRIFRNYNTIFNFSTSEIRLINRKNLINPFPEKSYGFVLIKFEDSYKIILKSKNSNTEKYKNINVNDLVIAIDGKKASEFSNNLELRNYQINKLNKEEQIKLKMKDGTIINLLPVENIYE